MKMHEKYLNKRFSFGLVLVLIVGLVITGCNGKKATNDTSLEINHGNIVFEMNVNLHTRISSKFPDSKMAMEDFQTSEKVTLDQGVISDFEIKDVQENILEGELSGREWPKVCMKRTV